MQEMSPLSNLFHQSRAPVTVQVSHDGLKASRFHLYSGTKTGADQPYCMQYVLPIADAVYYQFYFANNSYRELMGYFMKMAEMNSQLAFLDCDLQAGKEVAQFVALSMPFKYEQVIPVYVMTVSLDIFWSTDPFYSLA